MKIIQYAIILLAAFCASAQAAYTITFTQNGPNVVATGTGSINTLGIFVGAGASTNPQIIPSGGVAFVGAAGNIDIYSGVTGPAAIGPGFTTLATSGLNDLVGIESATNQIILPVGYLSGAPLSSAATWNGATLASLGLTPGIYTWTWPGDTFTVIVVAAAPASSIPTLSEWGLIILSSILAVFGMAYMRRTR